MKEIWRLLTAERERERERKGGWIGRHSSVLLLSEEGTGKV
jgi:hypothetical protein